ncbi:MAG: nucleotidyl transferase AbiEii/AbiGii toxin family protein [bacterium]|nr:nucleotidyl transferase AbiEii/AbiGii toxin family protein [bacterium]
MFVQILQDWTRDFLANLKPQDLPDSSYLAGGTAIALQLGHRRSVDLDFFVPKEFNEDAWQQSLEESFQFKLMQKDKQTLTGTVKKVKLSLLGYKYKLLEKPESCFNLQMAALPDLAAMKLDTVIKRGAKRDFIDIYFLAQQYGLKELFIFHDRKFGEGREIMVKKALVYFDDADKDYMPDMLVPTDWKEIKNWFVKQIKNL